MSALFTRLVLGYILALPFLAPLIARSLAGEQGHALVLRMSSTSGGVVQAFCDFGFGFVAEFAPVAALVVSDTPFEYRLPLPPGTYHNLRIDPGITAGLYTIERAAIVRGDGARELTIPLTELEVVQQLNVVERRPDRLALSAPDGSNDPIVVWKRPTPFTLTLEPKQKQHVLAYAALFWLGGTAAVWVLARLLRLVGLSSTGLVAWMSAFGTSSPAMAIVLSAFLATVLATYPVVFAARSYVSPANGGAGMLYGQPPFAPSVRDFVTEDVRGADIGAMMWQSLAHSLVQREALAAGEIPLWNRYTALGRPLWGQGLSYILDPLQWLTFVGRDPAAGWDWKFLAHRLLFAVGIGLASFAATGAWQPSALVAAAAPFAGSFSYRVNHPAIFALTYAPWTLLGWFLLAKAQSVSRVARAAMLLAVSSSLLLVAPPPKEAAVSLLAMSAIGTIAVLLSAGSWRLRGLRLAAAVVAGFGVVLVTAPHWLVFLDTLSRSGHNYETPYVILGDLANAVGLWTSPVIPGLPQPSLHLFALMLVATAATAPFRLWDDRASFAALVVAAFLLALTFGIAPPSVLVAVPLIAQIGHLSDVLVLAALTPVLIVCATGARILWTGAAARTIVATLATGAALLWVGTYMRGLGPTDRFEPWAAALLLPLALAWPVSLLVAKRQSSGAVMASAATMSVLVLPGGFHLELGVAAIDRLLFQPRPRVELTQSSPATDAIRTAAATTGPLRATGVQYSLFPGSGVLYGLEDVRGADPLEEQSYRDLIDAAGMQRMWYWFTWFESKDVPRLDPVLDMLNVGFLVSGPDLVPPGSRILPMHGPDRVRAIQRPTPWPRAFFVDGASSYTTPADLVQQVSARRAPFAAVRDGDAHAAESTKDLPRAGGPAVAADAYVLTPNTTSFRVRANREGLAVLGETYMADEFIATLNGAEVPYFRVNHVFKAVRIPGLGEWTVRFEYRPRRWNLALIAAACGVLVLMAIAVVAWRGSAQAQRAREPESAYV